MEFFSQKVSIIIVAFLGALWRIHRLKKDSAPKKVPLEDYAVMFIVSFFCAILFVGPICMMISVPLAYAVLVAFAISLAADLIILKFISIAKNFNLRKFLISKLGGKDEK